MSTVVQRLATVCGPRTVVLVSGIPWALFHWGLVLFLGGTPAGVPTWWALLCFTVGTVALGAVLASMQLRWGIWPGVVAHAAVGALSFPHTFDLPQCPIHSGIRSNPEWLSLVPLWNIIHSSGSITARSRSLPEVYVSALTPPPLAHSRPPKTHTCD